MTTRSETSQAAGSCWECGYSLRGLESRRCPECGRPFDPADPTTMNMGREVGWLAAWLMRPPGWMLHVLTAFAVLMALWGTATPGPGGEYPHFVLSRVFSPQMRRWIWNDLGYTEHTGRFVLGALAWAVVLGVWIVRRVARGITVRLLSRQKAAPFAYWRRWLITPVIFGLTLIVCRTWLPVYTGFWISKWGMERAPVNAQTVNPADVWIGVYPPYQTGGWPRLYQGPGDEVWVHVRYDAGFVHSGERPPTSIGAGPPWGPAVPRRFRAMGGGWYAFYRE
jgi:hypothetical protein